MSVGQALGQSQFQRSAYSLRMGYSMGVVLEHAPELAALSQFGVRGYYLDFSWQSDTSYNWAAAHAYPRIGLSMVLSDYQSQALGNTYALIPYVENTLPVTSKNIGFYYHLGLGLGYHSTIFDSIANPANEALSTHFNIAFDLRAGLEWQLNPSLRALLSVGVLHYSNGAVRKPNFGVNLTQLHAGLAYDFPRKLTLPVTAEKDSHKDSEWLLIITAGKRQVEGSTKFYPVQALSAERNWSLGRGDRFGVGLSYMNDAVWEEYQVWGDRWGAGEYPQIERWPTFNLGPYLNYEMLFGPFSGYLQAGVYLNNYQKEYSFTVEYPDGPHTHTTAFLRSPVFNRVGLRYRFKPNIVLALGLRTHLFVAQNIEIGLGTYF